MSVYKRTKSPYYHYDFQIRLIRFYGTTKCTTREEAEAFEAKERSHAKNRMASALQRVSARLQPPKSIVAPDKPQIGVYLLLLGGAVVYVGSSLRMPGRVAQHRANGRPFDQVFYIATSAYQRKQLEETLIAAIKPAQNNKVYRIRAPPPGNANAPADDAAGALDRKPITEGRDIPDD